MRKIIVITFAFLFLFMSLNENGFAIEKNKKAKLGFYINNILSTSFIPESVNLSINYASGYGDVTQYLMDRVLIQESTAFPLGISVCLNYDEEPLFLRGRALLPNSESFQGNPGDVFNITQERYFVLSRTGIPFQVGFNVPLGKKLCFGLNYYQSSKFYLEPTEGQDYVTIDTVESIPQSDGITSLWEMYFLRTYEKRSNTVTFRNIGVEVSLKYDLLAKLKRLSLAPEVGVNLGLLKRKLKREIELYGYTRSMLPEIIWPDNPLENYREFIESEEFRESSLKFKTRVFAGISAEFCPTYFIGIFCTARIYNKSITEEYLEPSVLGEFPFDLKVTQYRISVGIVFNITSFL